MPRPRGLPKRPYHMRHDEHFVEALTATRGRPVGHMVEIDELEPNPEQPRREFGDLQSLVQSIKERGVLEPILVRRIGESRYQILAGERRYRAALEAGIRQVPCVELEVDEKGVLEVSLIENLQRRDLSALEEADAVAMLVERYQYTHEMVARKLGKSRSTVTEVLRLAGVPPEVREECRRADITSRRLLLEIAKAGSPDEMLAMVRAIRAGGMTRDEARAHKRDETVAAAGADAARPRPFVFRFQPEDRSFRLQLSFRKSEVPREELIEILRGLLRDLETQS